MPTSCLYEFTGLADTVQTYVRELQTLLKQRQDDTRERNRQITDGVFAAVNDPQRPRPIPVVEPVPPALNSPRSRMPRRR